jgi:hypothetical protein
LSWGSQNRITINHENGGEGDFISVAEALNVKTLALFDSILLATCLNHGIHRGLILAGWGREIKPGWFRLT